MGTLSPSPWDLSLWGQNVWLNRATAVALHSGTRIGALVASLRCHILRTGAHTLSEPTCRSQPKPNNLTSPVLLVLRRRNDRAAREKLARYFGQPATPSKNGRNFVQTMGSTSNRAFLVGILGTHF